MKYDTFKGLSAKMTCLGLQRARNVRRDVTLREDFWIVLRNRTTSLFVESLLCNLSVNLFQCVIDDLSRSFDVGLDCSVKVYLNKYRAARFLKQSNKSYLTKTN